MDSMRHLSTSLPRTRRHEQPELLSDFKAAALSVTNLYKTAAAAQDKSRAAGYQDAVEDLLAFLDQENLGLMDGEGWRVRQWAAERLVDDGGLRQAPTSEDDAEERKEEPISSTQTVSRSSSPEIQRKMPPLAADSSDLIEDSAAMRRNATSEPPQTVPVQQAPPTHSFTFRHNMYTLPTNHDREGNMDLDAASTAPSTPTTVSTTAPDSASIRLVPRSSREGRRHRRNAAPPPNANNQTINFNLGIGAGSKRKMPYPDFFDISGMNNDESGSRGGKRGRHA
jgi:hypothetical protein